MSQIARVLYLSEPESEQAEAIRQAAAFARLNQAELTVLEVLPEVRAQFNPLPHELDINQLETALHSQRLQALSALIDELQLGMNVSVEVKNGKRFVETIRTVMAGEYDFLIKLAENPPWLERLFGSDDMHLLRKCPCPLWIIKPGEQTPQSKVLLALDFDTTDPGSALNPLNQSLLQLSADMVRDKAKQLHILHCWQAPDEMMLKAWGNLNDQQAQRYTKLEKTAHQQSMQRIADYINPQLGESDQESRYAFFHLIEGLAQKLIPTQARSIGADLLVMGSVARTGIRGVFIGNTAEMVLEQVTCSVLVIKPSDFESPVELED
jgi:nucleotide-binding universal stress UspA family protein